MSFLNPRWSAANAEFRGLFLIRFLIADIFNSKACWEWKNGRDGIDNQREWQTSGRLPGGGYRPFSRNCGIERPDARRLDERIPR